MKEDSFIEAHNRIYSLDKNESLIVVPWKSIKITLIMLKHGLIIETYHSAITSSTMLCHKNLSLMWEIEHDFTKYLSKRFNMVALQLVSTDLYFTLHFTIINFKLLAFLRIIIFLSWLQPVGKIFPDYK